LAATSFEAAIDNHGWSHLRVIDQQDFVRLEITDSRERLIIDLGRDSPAEEAIDTTDLGPTLSTRDLAARKTLALFGRAEPRDFADAYDLARRYGRDRLLDRAAADDPGFDKQIFAAMLTSIERLSDEDLPGYPARLGTARLRPRLGSRARRALTYPYDLSKIRNRCGPRHRLGHALRASPQVTALARSGGDWPPEPCAGLLQRLA